MEALLFIIPELLENNIFSFFAAALSISPLAVETKLEESGFINL